jgi:glycosyltransferase involved in cell wall biosynthesis
MSDRLTVFAAAADVAQIHAMLGPGPRIVVANQSPYRVGEQSTLLVRLLRSGVQLVHFPHYNLPLGYPGRFVVTIHDLFSYEFPDIHSGWPARRTNQLLIANAVKRAAAIVTPSKATAEVVAGRFPSATGRITAIPEAAQERFSPDRNAAGEQAWQRYFGIRPPYFLYLGQWKAYKNLPVLLHAFGEVLTDRPDVQLVIAGGDPRHPEVRVMAQGLPENAVVFPGHLPDDAVPDLYRGAAAVVVPSRAEGFGLPVLEAMACGVTVVCSDIAVLREIADGVAIFAEPNNAGAFAAAMREALLPTPPPPLAGEGRGGGRIPKGLERAQQFSWEAAAEETLAVYERALAGRARIRSDID